MTRIIGCGCLLDKCYFFFKSKNKDILVSDRFIVQLIMEFNLRAELQYSLCLAFVENLEH